MKQPKQTNGRVAIICGTVAVTMLGLAYASVPLYRMFCNATGYAGTPQVALAPSNHVLDKTITVRFDANVAPGLDWDFAPLVNTMELKIGENALAVFKATNRSSEVVVGSATFNVTPDQAGGFFNKVQCFCFTEQRLDPGETVDMPVSFFIDPAIVNDNDGSRVTNITLSYTFHRVAHPKTGLASHAARPGTPGGALPAPGLPADLQPNAPKG